MTVLRAIDPAPFVALAGALPSFDCGQAPQLRWIEISQLVVDPCYQREIGKTGQKNIIRIAREFEWARFSPVIVAPAKDKFVIIDGQHRSTAAAMRGHKKVPCQIITADQRKQAAAFAAINCNVTAMSTMQVHAAKVAAGDVDALRLAKVCAAGGVTILRYPLQATKQKVGETMAVTQLRQALDRFGEKALRVSLQVITRTRDGNPGMVRGYLVLALCTVLEAEPEWLDSPRLLKVFEKLDLHAAWDDAVKKALASRSKIITTLVDDVSEFLDKAFTARAA